MRSDRGNEYNWPAIYADKYIWRAFNTRIHPAQSKPTFLHLETTYLGVNALKIESVKLDENVLGICVSQNGIPKSILIDYEHILKASPGECIDTVCHEAFHAYEHSVVNSLDFEDEAVKTSLFYEPARAWRNSFENYSTEDFEIYRAQRVERDANTYAKSRRAYYEKQIERYYVDGSE
jgi:hypothetical protein